MRLTLNSLCSSVEHFNTVILESIDGQNKALAKNEGHLEEKGWGIWSLLFVVAATRELIPDVSYKFIIMKG